MEPETLNLETGAKALAILSLIPVVIFALWAEYFGRYLHQLMIKKPQFERDPELEKVRLISLCVILFQLTLFLGSSEIRQAYPMSTEVTFVVATLLQLWLQSRTEKKIQPNSKTGATDDLGALAIRAAVSWIAGAAVYVLILAISLRTGLWIAEKAQVSVRMGSVFLLIGGAIGVIAGLAVNFILTPLHLRKTLPTRPIQDPQLRSLLESCFISAGLNPPSFWMIEFEKIQLGTTWLAGMRNGPGLFRQSMFISQIAIKNLSPSELKAIVLNQVSHLVLKHFRRRYFTSFALILMTTVLAVLSVFLSEAFVATQTALEVIGPAVALLSFLASFRYLSEQSRRHETEADLYSIRKLGVTFETYAAALRKLEQPMESDSPFAVLSNLETERRIQAVADLLAVEEKVETKKAA